MVNTLERYGGNMETILVIWIVFCLIVAILAGDVYGRSRFGYFVLAFLLSPIISGVILLIVGRSVEAEARRAVAIRAETERLDAQRTRR